MSRRHAIALLIFAGGSEPSLPPPAPDAGARCTVTAPPGANAPAGPSGAGKPTPQVMVAENDVATGRLIEAISRSTFWPKTVAFLIEDDPQDGGDHVEAHRSPCLVISPFARHHATVSSHFDNASLFRTMEILLGVPPMNRGDAQAAAILEAFTDLPDLTPYTALPSTIPMDALNSASSPGAEESARMDFSEPDRAKGLDRVVWRAIKGTPPPWPEAADDD
ncbi:MAG: hypothetical protein EXR72_04225 [Myxococcales bacterium]|nr:hypothetical protein [Myxococcales bacterium]